MSAAGLKSMAPEGLANVDLVITSYGALLRYNWLTITRWQVAVIDEAQAIKNPGAKQTRAVKKLIATDPRGTCRKAGREPSLGPLVDLPLHPPGVAGFG